jgi:hypothetical protein
LLISIDKPSLPGDASTRVEFLGVFIDTELMCVFAFPIHLSVVTSRCVTVVDVQGDECGIKDPHVL